MNKQKYLLKNLGLLTISNFSSKILVFLLVPLYTSILTTTEYGTYDLAISTVSLLYPILTLNIVDGVMRFSMDKNYSKENIAIIAFKFLSISTILYGLITIIIKHLGLFEGLEIFIFLYYLSYSTYQFFVQISKGLEKVSDMAIAGVISTLSLIIFNLLFLFKFKLGLNGFFLANILSQLIPSLYFIFRLKFWNYIKDFNIDKSLEKEMLKYSIPLIATTLGWWANNTLDKYAVTWLCGVAANGILSVSYKIPTILNTLQGIFTSAWQISAIKEYGEEETSKFYGKTFSLVNFLMCAACSVLIILTRPLAHMLYANDFYVAWEYVPFLLISSVINCASGLLGPILSAKKDTKAMMWSAIIGVIFNAIFNIVLIYLIGIQGATIATMGSSLIIYLIRRYGANKDIVIYDNYWVTWILLIIEASVEICLSNYVIELVIIGIVLIINKNLIIEAIDKLKKIKR